MFICSELYTDKKKICKVLRLVGALYGAEGSTLKTSSINKVEAFKMWLYREIFKISLTEKKTNENVCRRVNKARRFFDIGNKTNADYLGHIMLNEKCRLDRDD